MREILFRGKRVDKGRWIEGYLSFVYIDVPEKARIYSPAKVRSFDVITETVGQYTGLCDKNGTRIFEHDIIKIKYPFDEPCNEVVSWSVEGARWDFGGVDAYFANPQKWAEVIGNVFDNPELLKGE